MAWNDDLQGVEVDKNRFCVTMQFQSSSDSDNFALSAIYAPCEDGDRPQFFEAMSEMAAAVSGPWMLVGDFNMYRFEHEKSKGRRNWALMDTFNSWIREHALDDIEITNRTFT